MSPHAQVSIYVIENLVNSKRYVGITTKTVDKRWRGHQYQALHDSPYTLHSAIRKYGEKKFVITHVASSRSWKNACIIEQLLIRTLKTHVNEHGYNMTLGGEGTLGRKHTQTTRQKLSIAKRNRPSMSKHTRQKIGESFKHRSKATQELFIRAFKDRNHTLSAKQAIAQSKFKQIERIDSSGNIECYDSMLTASRLTGIHYSNISGCCLGYRKSAGGYRWRYTTQ